MCLVPIVAARRVVTAAEAPRQLQHPQRPHHLWWPDRPRRLHRHVSRAPHRRVSIRPQRSITRNPKVCSVPFRVFWAHGRGESSSRPATIWPAVTIDELV